MKRSRILQIVPVLAAAGFVLRFAVPGRAADDITVTPPVAAFDRIQLAGAFVADVTAGSPTAHVTLRGDRASVDRVTTVVRDHELVIGMRDGESHVGGHTVKVEIALPVLRGFENQGAGSATLSGLTGSDLDIDVPGAATITASGRARHLRISLDGAGKIDAAAVDARDVDVDSDGVGGVYVRASGTLTMNVNGVGEIRYAGNPTHVESHVNGIGRISRM